MLVYETLTFVLPVALEDIADKDLTSCQYLCRAIIIIPIWK
jgi:hypothetical protein